MAAGILWGILIVGIYITLYVLNQRTPRPEGCDDIEPGEQCAGCHVVDCHLHKRED